MPTLSDRQLAADALHRAFLVDFLARIEAEELEFLDDELHDSDSSSGTSPDTESSSGWSSSSSSDSTDSNSEPTPAEQYITQMAALFADRYLEEQTPIPKTQELMHLILHEYKYNRPHIFHSFLRIDPDCFDDFIAAIEDDEVFHNNSNNAQMPVEEQAVIALYRLGHYGNAASSLKVALQFGVGVGTVHLVTTRILKATCSQRFRSASVQWASPEAKAAAKEWVESMSCPAWRNGWLMVDGTLVPLFRQPSWFGNIWFDRKSNYSLNVQVNYFSNLKCLDYKCLCLYL
jgi:hypothetical protein